MAEDRAKRFPRERAAIGAGQRDEAGSVPAPEDRAIQVLGAGFAGFALGLRELMERHEIVACALAAFSADGVRFVSASMDARSPEASAARHLSAVMEERFDALAAETETETETEGAA